MKGNIFQTVKRSKVKRSMFNLSHEVKLTTKMGKLIPVLCEEVLPGDFYKIKTESLIRLAPMVAPVMHRVNVYFHYFYVPNRIIWEPWQKFITGDDLGANEVPKFQDETYPCEKGSLADYLGVPIGTTCSEVGGVNKLPFYAYWKIYNEYYRDQNQIAEIPLESMEWENAGITSLGGPLTRSWEKDYFTSALPWTQKGEAPTIPIEFTTGYREPSIVRNVGTGAPNTSGNSIGASADGGKLEINGGLGEYFYLDNINLENGNVGMSINDFRMAHRIQRWMEKQARAGSRYVETLLSHFNVIADDASIQRPEYLGGGKSPIIISEVLNTTGTEDAPQGDMAGHGLGVGVSNTVNKMFKEHGWLMCVMSVMPKPNYQQGLHKKFSRADKFDFAWPEFANLGEQEVKTQELYSLGDLVSNQHVFGYQSRYAEYKYQSNRVHGDFTDNLSQWHMGRIFDDSPSLNSVFLECDTNEINERVFAAGNLADTLWIQLYHDIRAMRPLPYYGEPTL